MARWILLVLAFALGISACEDVYHASLDDMDGLLVVEATIIHGRSDNYVKLFKTVGFNDVPYQFPVVAGAKVWLVDNQNGTILLRDSGSGLYRLEQPLDPQKKYKLMVESEGETFESSYEKVPGQPDIDTVYVLHAEKLAETVTDEAAGNLYKLPGAIMYADIAARDENRYYRFISRKIVQYVYELALPGVPPSTVYAWRTVVPLEVFNIAAPPEYTLSRDIRKHPLVFLERNFNVYKPDTQTFFVGWIYVCLQYALSEPTYNFYRDLNSQLSAGGKFFDPLYVQAKGNLVCVSDLRKVVLGNFEISTVREHRFYVQPLGSDRYVLKRLPNIWSVPGEGFTVDEPPDWWGQR